MIALFALLAATAVFGALGGAYSSTASVPPDARVDMVAFVDLEGRVMAVRPDGSNLARLSPERGVYTWPVWSPDARSVAFSGLPSDGGARGPLTLFTLPLNADGPDAARAVYANGRGYGPVLPGMPHYVLWSPDGRWLGFMANTPEGLSLLVDDPDDEAAAAHLLSGAPLYATWSADSAAMVVHSGLGHHFVEVDEDVTISGLDILSANYRAPAWRPRSGSVAYVAEDADGGETLYLDEPSLGRRKALGEARGQTAFLWSPGGETLAVARTGQPSRATGGYLYEGVRLISPEGERIAAGIEQVVVAFFWSPDGEKIAYVTFAEGGDSLRWNVLDVASGQSWPLVDFLPTRDQLSILVFFDQFAQSHAVWSPDSRAIVFAGIIVGNVGVSASLSSQETPKILALPIEPASSAQTLGDGIMATWSPR